MFLSSVTFLFDCAILLISDIIMLDVNSSRFLFTGHTLDIGANLMVYFWAPLRYLFRKKTSEPRLLPALFTVTLVNGAFIRYLCLFDCLLFGPRCGICLEKKQRAKTAAGAFHGNTHKRSIHMSFAFKIKMYFFT